MPDHIKRAHHKTSRLWESVAAAQWHLPVHKHFYCRFDVICFDFFQQFAKTIQQDFSKFTYDQQWIENAFTFEQEFINL